ncbi:hypothetical protein CHARACLAT_016204 [Characodon lateralis]|uniref:Uncharacterized protein n=1 Tax=Characodon lateralis TaxID=208331 RepID=A0ABU7D9I9_9TELE|nr:hypothetical protein [Characodon lateralis]
MLPLTPRLQTKLQTRPGSYGEAVGQRLLHVTSPMTYEPLHCFIQTESADCFELTGGVPNIWRDSVYLRWLKPRFTSPFYTYYTLRTALVFGYSEFWWIILGSVAKWEYFDLVPPNKLLTYNNNNNNNTSSVLRHYRAKHENTQPPATNQVSRKQELDEALADFIMDSQIFSVSKPRPPSQTVPCHTSLLCSL